MSGPAATLQNPPPEDKPAPAFRPRQNHSALRPAEKSSGHPEMFSPQVIEDNNLRTAAAGMRNQ